MKNKRTPRRLIAFVAVLVAAQLTTAVHGSADGLRPGDRVAVGGFTFIVPSPGRAEWAAATEAAGGERTAGIRTLRDGTVRAHSGSFGAGSIAATPIDACKDGAYALNTSTWKKPYRWRFRVRSTPAGVKRDAAARALRSAAVTIVNGRGCKMPDQISATQQYLGKTAAAGNISTTSSCTSADSKSVISFGTIAPSDLGLTCWWMSAGATVEADIVFNKANYQWTTKWGSGCSNRWSVQAVATHELGHVFGLDHVTPLLDGNQTMSPVIAPCQNSQASLGRGDILGLRSKY